MEGFLIILLLRMYIEMMEVTSNYWSQLAHNKVGIIQIR